MNKASSTLTDERIAATLEGMEVPLDGASMSEMVARFKDAWVLNQDPRLGLVYVETAESLLEEIDDPELRKDLFFVETALGIREVLDSALEREIETVRAKLASRDDLSIITGDGEAWVKVARGQWVWVSRSQRIVKRENRFHLAFLMEGDSCSARKEVEAPNGRSCRQLYAWEESTAEGEVSQAILDCVSAPAPATM